MKDVELLPLQENLKSIYTDVYLKIIKLNNEGRCDIEK
jgi:hypothetical protein